MERFPTDAQPASRADRSLATLLDMTANFASPDYSTMTFSDLLGLAQWTRTAMATAARVDRNRVIAYCDGSVDAPWSSTIGRLWAALACRLRDLRVTPPTIVELRGTMRRTARKVGDAKEAAPTATPTGAASQS